MRFASTICFLLGPLVQQVLGREQQEDLDVGSCQSLPIPITTGTITLTNNLSCDPPVFIRVKGDAVLRSEQAMVTTGIHFVVDEKASLTIAASAIDMGRKKEYSAFPVFLAKGQLIFVATDSLPSLLTATEMDKHKVVMIKDEDILYSDNAVVRFTESSILVGELPSDGGGAHTNEPGVLTSSGDVGVEYVTSAPHPTSLAPDEQSPFSDGHGQNSNSIKQSANPNDGGGGGGGSGSSSSSSNDNSNNNNSNSDGCDGEPVVPEDILVQPASSLKDDVNLTNGDGGGSSSDNSSSSKTDDDNNNNNNNNSSSNSGGGDDEPVVSEDILALPASSLKDDVNLTNGDGGGSSSDNTDSSKTDDDNNNNSSSNSGGGDDEPIVSEDILALPAPSLKDDVNLTNGDGGGSSSDNNNNNNNNNSNSDGDDDEPVVSNDILVQPAPSLKDDTILNNGDGDDSSNGNSIDDSNNTGSNSGGGRSGGDYTPVFSDEIRAHPWPSLKVGEQLSANLLSPSKTSRVFARPFDCAIVFAKATGETPRDANGVVTGPTPEQTTTLAIPDAHKVAKAYAIREDVLEEAREEERLRAEGKSLKRGAVDIFMGFMPYGKRGFRQRRAREYAKAHLGETHLAVNQRGNLEGSIDGTTVLRKSGPSWFGYRKKDPTYEVWASEDGLVVTRGGQTDWVLEAHELV